MAVSTLPVGERIDYSVVLPHRTKLVILGAVLLSLFLAALDQTIVATALPAIIRDFNGLGLIGWISTGYLLASTAMVPIYGKLSDIYGRRPVLIGGIITFLIGSALCGFAGSMEQLIAFRVIQGLGAAALTSTAFAIPADLFTPAERPKYVGVFGAVFGLSSVVGPFLGGLLTDQVSWHWVFFVNLPIGLIALGFVLAKMPQLASGVRAPIDWVGSGLLVTAVVPLLLGLTLDKTVHPWGSPMTLGLFALAAVATALFIWNELRVPAPIISLSLFRNRTFTVAVIASILNGAAFFGAIIFISLFLVNVTGVSATAAGSAQIPLMLAFVLSSIGASQLVSRIGRYKPFIVVGFAITTLGFYLLSQINVNSSVFDITWRMLVLGLGLGPALPLLNLATQNAVGFDQLGMATASRQFFQQLGQAMGAAIFSVLLTYFLAGHIQTQLAPIAQTLPAEARDVFAELKLGTAVSEGVAGGGADAGAKLVSAAQQNGAPAPAVDALRGAQGAIDTAVKTAFANSISTIYLISIALAATNMLLTLLFLPEIPLRKTNDAVPSE